MHHTKVVEGGKKHTFYVSSLFFSKIEQFMK